MSYATSPNESMKGFATGQSHPVEVSPSLNSTASSMANTPSNSDKQPGNYDSMSRWRDMEEPLTPRALHAAMVGSKGQVGDSDEGSVSHTEVHFRLYRSQFSHSNSSPWSFQKKETVLQLKLWAVQVLV